MTPTNLDQPTRKQSKVKYDWPGLTIAAASDGQPFSDVEIITTKQHMADMFVDSVRSTSSVKLIIDTFPLPLRCPEFVVVEEDEASESGIKVKIGVHADTINEDVFEYALSLLEQVDNFEKGSYHYFSNEKDFTREEIIKLIVE